MRFSRSQTHGLDILLPLANKNASPEEERAWRTLPRYSAPALKWKWSLWRLDLQAPLMPKGKKKEWDQNNHVRHCVKVGDATGHILVPSPTGSHPGRGDKVNRQLWFSAVRDVTRISTGCEEGTAEGESGSSVELPRGSDLQCTHALCPPGWP